MVSAQPADSPATGAGLSNFSQVVARHAASSPNRPALISADGATTVSYAELEGRVASGAADLGAAGLERGMRVAVVGANSPEWVVAYLSVLRAGGVAAPLNPHLTPSELAHLMSLLTPSIVLADREFSGRVSLIEAGISVLPMELGAAALSVDPDADTDAGEIDASGTGAEDLAVLIATSGTSGDPKAVMLSHRALLASCANSASVSPGGADTVALAMLPMFHIYGLNAVLGAALYLGATSVIVDGYPEDLGEIIAARAVTELPITPSILYRLMQDDQLTRQLAGVEHVMSGGAPLPLALADRFAALTGFGLHQGYGMTETAPVIASTRGIAAADVEKVRARTRELAIGGHVGPPTGEVEVRIAPGEGAGSPRPGEIHVRGENLFSGYWPDDRDVLDEQGWFATGDIGFLDDGQLYLVDRASDLIIVSGFNVYPTEVERVLAAIPGIEEAAVLGQPDENTGQRVVAFVAVGRAKPSLAGVRAECAERLARYKRPVEIYFLAKLPKTKAGKVAKSRLSDLLDTVEAH